MNLDIKKHLNKTAVPMILSLILAVLLIIQVGVGVWSIYAITEVKEEVPAKIIRKDSTPSNIKDAIKKGGFFGEYVPEDLDNAKIKKSMLNLKVVGVIYSEDEESSQVIIKSAHGDEKIYRMGDNLPGGVTIKRITPFGVVVSRNGSLERLSLPKDDLTFSPPAQPLIGE